MTLREALTVRIRAISSVVPDWRVDNATIAEWSGLEEATVAGKIGVESRRFLTHEETTSDLAARACEKLFADAPGLSPEAVGLLAVVTQNPDHSLPHTAALVQDRLGLGHDTASFDTSLSCSGYVYGLSALKGMMMAEGIDDAVLVTCDPYSKVMARDNRDVIGLFGDAATATWLSAEAGASIGRGDFGTDGRGARHLIVEAGGAAHPRDHLDGTAADGDDETAFHLQMNGRAIFNFVMERIPASIEGCLERNGLGRDDIGFYVFHQANAFMLKALATKLKLPADKVPVHMKDCGNTVSSTIPMVLDDLIRDGRAAGARMLICGFGVGLSWASNIITFEE